ncbi:hypothetical protein D7316_00289 [Gordonia insulae]|uniref:Uncharacterized protein n=1 Tax=Gordonia insulae TaxID=2420509 RepID=A0A3G8JHJ3_9ACTN|nr:hypothetical protein D7316_00289 [Gordonia insulae]
MQATEELRAPIGQFDPAGPAIIRVGLLPDESAVGQIGDMLTGPLFGHPQFGGQINRPHPTPLDHLENPEVRGTQPIPILGGK